MKYLILLLVVAVVVVVAGGLYIRFAVSDTARWHRWGLPGMAAGEYPSRNGDLITGAVAGPEVLAELDAIIMATPRTMRLAGSVDEAMITYVTRTALWGFPDYTTVKLTNAAGVWTLSVFGRSRFGASDLGVNKARIDRWLSGIALAKP